MNKHNILEELSLIKSFIGERLDNLFIELCSSSDGVPNIGKSPPILGVTLLQEAREKFGISDQEMRERYGVPLTTFAFETNGDMNLTLEQARAYTGTNVCLIHPRQFEKFKGSAKALENSALDHFSEMAASQIDEGQIQSLLEKKDVDLYSLIFEQPQIVSTSRKGKIFADVLAIIYGVRDESYFGISRAFVDSEFDYVTHQIQGDPQQLSMLFLLHDIAHELQLASRRRGNVLFCEAQADVIGIHNFLSRGGSMETVKDFLAIRAAISILGSSEPGYNTALIIDSALRGTGYVEPEHAMRALANVRRALATRIETKERVYAFDTDKRDKVADDINYAQYLLEGNTLRNPHVRRLTELYIEGIQRLSPVIAGYARFNATHNERPKAKPGHTRLKRSQSRERQPLPA